MRLLSAALLVLLACAPAAAQATFTRGTLSDAITEVLGNGDFRDATWGALVVDIATGERLYANNEYRRFIPASNVKLFTTAAVLDALGPDFRYTTRLYADGDVRGGTLHGSLVVRGAGDPTFGGRYTGGDLMMTFRAWADSLSARGIRRITGPVVGDDDVFDDLGLGAGWSWDDLVYGYAAPISGLQFNEGTVTLTARGTTAGQPASLSVVPDLGGYVTLVNRTTTTDGGESQGRYARALAANAYTVSSSLPAGATLTQALAVVNPTDYFVQMLVATLRREGIEVSGEGVDVDTWGERPAYDRLTRVATYRSPPMSAIVGVTNDDSNNLYAETLMRTLGAYEGRDSGYFVRGSFEAGWDAAQPILRRLGVDPSAITLADGSGLSNMNRTTPEATVALLIGMYNHPRRDVWDAFYRSLPLGGHTGTLRTRYETGDARGNVRAKTGYISGARTLSGYVTTRTGRILAFSLLCNHYSTRTARVNRAQDAVVELLADYEGR